MIGQIYDAEELARSLSEGFFVKDYLGSIVSVETKNTKYEIHLFRDGTIKAKTHPLREGGRALLPELTDVYIQGSTWGGSMIKVNYIGVDMHLEFYANGKRYLTSPIGHVSVYEGKL